MGPCRYVTVWEAGPACLMWCIWGERNQHTFKDKESTVLKFLYLNTLRMGINVLYSLNVFLDGVSRDSTFVLLILRLVSCFSFFFPCIAVFYDLYTLCVHFLIFNKLQLLIQKKKTSWIPKFHISKIHIIFLPIWKTDQSFFLSVKNGSTSLMGFREWKFILPFNKKVPPIFFIFWCYYIISQVQKEEKYMVIKI